MSPFAPRMMREVQKIRYFQTELQWNVFSPPFAAQRRLSFLIGFAPFSRDACSKQSNTTLGERTNVTFPIQVAIVVLRFMSNLNSERTRGSRIWHTN